MTHPETRHAWSADLARRTGGARLPGHQRPGMPSGRVAVVGRPRDLHQCRARSREAIQPLGVTLDRGETLSVTWIPGETEYTLDVARARSKCA